MKQVKKRNRQMTMERILWALGEVISERGAERSGINAVAEKAGVNKVLIYRYFGGYEGLMQQFVQRGQFLALYNEQYVQNHPDPTNPEDRHRIWSDYMIGLLRELKTRKPSQEVLKWELANHASELSRQLSDTRNESFQKLIRQLAPEDDCDPVAVTAVMLSAITFLVLQSQHHFRFIDIDLDTEEGWQRIERAIDRIYGSLSQSMRPQPANH